LELLGRPTRLGLRGAELGVEPCQFRFELLLPTGERRDARLPIADLPGIGRAQNKRRQLGCRSPQVGVGFVGLGARVALEMLLILALAPLPLEDGSLLGQDMGIDAPGRQPGGQRD
jgi:hypothetical protein